MIIIINIIVIINIIIIATIVLIVVIIVLGKEPYDFDDRCFSDGMYEALLSL